MCIFVEDWKGKCKEECDPCCYKHNHLVCCVCGASATHTCAESAGSLVCGALWCDDCRHGCGWKPKDIEPGFDYEHCRKKVEEDVSDEVNSVFNRLESKLEGRASTIRRLQKQVEQLKAIVKERDALIDNLIFLTEQHSKRALKIAINRLIEIEELRIRPDDI